MTHIVNRAMWCRHVCAIQDDYRHTRQRPQIKMHALFKRDKLNFAQRTKKAFGQTIPTTLPTFGNGSDAHVDSKFVKSVAVNDPHALNLNFLHRKRRLRVYEHDLKSVATTYLEAQDRLVSPEDRYRNNYIEASTPRGNVSPIHLALRIHSGKNRRRPNTAGGTKGASGARNGVRRQKHRSLASFALISNWHEKTMKRVEGVRAFGKNYLKSRNSGDDNANHEGTKVVNHLLHMSKKKRNLRRKTELLLSRHPEKQFVKEKSDLQLRCAKILASGSRRDKQAIARLRRFRIQQSVKG